MRIFFLCVFLCNVLTVWAQKPKGNIVEYFGKEKVEDIHEGELYHVFKKALIFKKENFPEVAEAVVYDPLLFEYIGESNSNIQAGKIAGENYKDEPVKWDPTSVNDKNEFEDLGSGYLYLEFNSDTDSIVLFEASGHTNVLINGYPHEGDHYDFGWSLVPVKLKKGKNEFLLSAGRFPRMRARLIKPAKKLQITPRDMTLPDILKGEEENFPAAVRIVNSDNRSIKDFKIIARIDGEMVETKIDEIPSLYVRKIPFEIPAPKNIGKKEKVNLNLELHNSEGKIIDTYTTILPVKSKYQHHKRTFFSDIDGSVQYYSVAPSLDTINPNQALFLSLHGASVEAVNQANAYKQKDWGHIVAPTNRRPFGFAWEDWGRLDALEVLSHAEKMWNTNPSTTYLTGHSMGGHGTWYLGVTYPDKFAAIAPAAGYPDLLGYRESFLKRISKNHVMLEERFNMNEEEFLEKTNLKFKSEKEERMNALIRSAGNTSRTLELIENYLHFGIYVLHGEDDTVVPTFIAREMRERLGEFHNDFAYYEYPEGTHWYGDHSMDWPLIFDYFKVHSQKPQEDLKKFKFKTASPGVSEKAYFIKILQQKEPFEISAFSFEKDSTIWNLTTKNIHTLELDLRKIQNRPTSILIDGNKLVVPDTGLSLILSEDQNSWQFTKRPEKKEKGPHRAGGFKNVFRHNPVLVYATHGTEKENDWYYNRAKYDAEKFYYRANGDLTLIADSEFILSQYPDRNIILYGNSDNNSAWDKLLKKSPIQVSKGKMQFDEEIIEGRNWGSYFIYPRMDSEIASIGVISATGEEGMKAAWANDYLLNGTFYPDFMIFNGKLGQEGLTGVKAAGFFDNNWSLDNAKMEWNK
ncbi:alpha/beta hydrolase [Gramella sp. KN1008]|uniref:alpha/beta hydrolase n=1 Tax=Gramella sp. KN1008 TaxID=2529298 RepID=UPI00103C3CD7|nr:alpha/beta hydrolase [Gramella sp. KN1008]TBW28671.1 alpha/beta hydrolase [Gramella sp. KN1008]